MSERAVVETLPETTEEVRLVPMYKVLIHDDDVTTMQFVVEVLVRVFKLEGAKAFQVMMETHLKGIALVVVLPLEEAELRVEQAESMARTSKLPLKFSIEPE